MLKLDAICRNMTPVAALAAIRDPQTPAKRRTMLRAGLAAARHKIRVDVALAEELAERVRPHLKAQAQPIILRMWQFLRDCGADDIETRARTPEPLHNHALARALQKAQEKGSRTPQVSAGM